jgi:hypothetical protein
MPKFCPILVRHSVKTLKRAKTEQADKHTRKEKNENNEGKHHTGTKHKVGADFADKRRSLGRYSSLAD